MSHYTRYKHFFTTRVGRSMPFSRQSCIVRSEALLSRTGLLAFSSDAVRRPSWSMNRFRSISEVPEVIHRREQHALEGPRSYQEDA